MIVKQTHNPDDLKAVLSHPAIWDAITSDDGPPFEKYDFAKIDEWLCIAGYQDEEPFAAMLYHPHLDGTKLHIHVLPEHRDKSRDFAAKALEFSKLPLYAEIPEMYPNVIRFAEEFGFKKFITYHDRHKKNGALCDVVLLRKI